MDRKGNSTVLQFSSPMLRQTGETNGNGVNCDMRKETISKIDENFIANSSMSIRIHPLTSTTARTRNVVADIYTGNAVPSLEVRPVIRVSAKITKFIRRRDWNP